MITCLLKQNVDLGLFAKDLVDLLNEQQSKKLFRKGGNNGTNFKE